MFLSPVIPISISCMLTLSPYCLSVQVLWICVWFTWLVLELDNLRSRNTEFSNAYTLHISAVIVSHCIALQYKDVLFLPWLVWSTVLLLSVLKPAHLEQNAMTAYLVLVCIHETDTLISEWCDCLRRIEIESEGKSVMKFPRSNRF